MKKIKELQNFTKIVDSITQLFCDRYFDKTKDWYYVSDEREGVLSVGDYFFNLSDIITAIRFSAIKEQVFDFYDRVLTASMKNESMKVNFRYFLKYGEEAENEK